MTKMLIQNEDITIGNICAPVTGAPQCRRQILLNLKAEIDYSTIIVVVFNTPTLPMDRSP
jgi:hypothetical protein